MLTTDGRVRKAMGLLDEGRSLTDAALRAGIDVKTVRKYRDLGRLPSEMAEQRERTWRTHPDPFEAVWEDVRQQLEQSPRLQAKTLFEWLLREGKGEFSAGQLRTLQRRVKEWKGTYGLPKEVFFAQIHHPGRLSASDFTWCNSLEVTIAGQRFDHLLYHFVLTYSNWESATICFSESFESLAEGLQQALFELGGVPARHRSDRMSAAVNNLSEKKEFTRRYATLMAHYGLVSEKTQAGEGSENGDVEQSHRRIKDALDQALMLRGHREFESRPAYERFVREILDQRNAPRREKLQEEMAVLGRLPPRRFESFKRWTARVGQGSTIQVDRNAYSVPSRLIGEKVEVRMSAEQLEVWYAGKLMESLPRLRGRGKSRINYRHVIDWLVRKPGAFENYRYREEMFPTTHFRMAYDMLLSATPAAATREYLHILHLAATESETAVDEALRQLLATGSVIALTGIEELVRRKDRRFSPTDVAVAIPQFGEYDALLMDEENDDEEQGCEGTAGAVPEGTPSADSARELRGSGAVGGATDAQLRTVSVGTGGAGMSGPAVAPDRSAAAPVGAAARQDPVDAGPQAAPGQGGPPVPDAARRELSGSAGEHSHFRERREREDALLVRVRSGVNSAAVAEGFLHDVLEAGARPLDRQARPEAEPDDQAAGGIRGAHHRRPGLRPAEPRGDGSAVHAAGGTLRAAERPLNEQSALLEVGADLQGRHDHGGGHRPTGASQHHRRTEPAQLPPGARQEIERVEPRSAAPRLAGDGITALSFLPTELGDRVLGSSFHSAALRFAPLHSEPRTLLFPQGSVIVAKGEG